MLVLLSGNLLCDCVLSRGMHDVTLYPWALVLVLVILMEDIDVVTRFDLLSLFL